MWDYYMVTACERLAVSLHRSQRWENVRVHHSPFVSSAEYYRATPRGFVRSPRLVWSTCVVQSRVREGVLGLTAASRSPRKLLGRHSTATHLTSMRRVYLMHMFRERVPRRIHLNWMIEWPCDRSIYGSQRGFVKLFLKQFNDFR